MNTLTFDEADATDIGGIDDPLAALLGRPSRFHMTRSRIVNGDMRIDFCRIADQGWLAIIVALGNTTTPNPQNQGVYVATVDDGAGTSEDISVDMHAWRSRWRWMNKPWPFPPMPLTDLYAAKLLPRFDPALTHGTDYYYGPYEYEPLGLAGLEPYMPQTGGRGDIGPVTGCQGWYLCHEGDTQGLADLLAQAEAGATFQWDYHDPTTGRCIDPVIEYPTAGLYAERDGANPSIPSSPYLPLANITLSGPPGTKLSTTTPAGLEWNFVNSSDTPLVQLRIPQDTTIPASGTITLEMELDGSRGNTLPLEPLTVVLWDGTPTAGVTANIAAGGLVYGSLTVIDPAHMPACEYVPYLLTGDPYFLEILQQQAAYIVMAAQNAPTHSGANRQPRDSGWSARTLAQAARVSLDNPPSWLLPRSVWQTAIDRWEPLWRADTVDNTSDPGRQVLHQIAYDVSNNGYQPWQEDIALNGLAWMMLLHPDSAWKTDLAWLVQQSMARLTEGSGWPPTVPTCYIAINRPAGGQPLYGSWAECWAATMPTLEMTAPPTTVWLHDPDYLGQMAAAMSLAWQAGATECGAALSLLNSMIGPPLEQRQINMPSNYAIAGPTEQEMRNANQQRRERTGRHR
jgi:hypothetical protein